MGDLPVVQLYELEELIDAVARFYTSSGYKEFSFIEGGFNYQGIYHAHLHLLPRYVSPEKEFPGILEGEVKQINSWEEVEDFYKKNGRYVAWTNSSGFFISKVKVDDKKPEDKTIAEFLGSQWKKEKDDISLARKAKRLQVETLQEWERYRDKNKKKSDTSD